MFKKLDKDGDGQISGAEFTHGGGLEGSAAKGAATPPPIEVEAVPTEEVGRRLGAAFGTASEAWEDLTGSPDSNHMTEEQFLAKADQLGMTPEEAKAAFKAMDTDGDGKVSFDEFQAAMGVTPEDCKRRLLKKYGNAEKALAAADTDGDGNSLRRSSSLWPRSSTSRSPRRRSSSASSRRQTADTSRARSSWTTSARRRRTSRSAWRRSSSRRPTPSASSTRTATARSRRRSSSPARRRWASASPRRRRCSIRRTWMGRADSPRTSS